ncbi:hypothetical protein T03_3899, partial [Trichinella britovi]
LRYLHFNDNSEAVQDRETPRYDRLFKIRPLIESIRQSCLQYQSIDEEIIPYKGRNKLKQCIQRSQRNGASKLTHGEECQGCCTTSAFMKVKCQE